MIDRIQDVSPADYTPERLKADLSYLCETFPTNRNPTDGGTCVYRSGEGMCLIGLWLELRGHEYDPEWDERGSGANEVLTDLDYSAETALVACEIQTVADSYQRPWSEVAVR